MPIVIAWPASPTPPNPDPNQERLCERLRSTRADFVSAWRDYCQYVAERSTIIDELIWTVRALTQILSRHGTEQEAVAVDFLRTAAAPAQAPWDGGSYNGE